VGLARRIVALLSSPNRSHNNKPGGAFGGYTAALLCIYLLLTRPLSKPEQPDPIDSPFQLFSPNSPGTVRLTATLLKPRSRIWISVVQIEIQRPATSPKVPSQITYKTCAFGIINMSNISLETGLTLPMDRVIPKEDIPDRERECKQ
jgi:hypothetical protein